MKKQIIRLTENDLHTIIRDTVKSFLRENMEDERHVLKLHKEEPMDDDLPPLDEPPMGAPEPPAPPMGNEPPMGGDEPPMGNPDDDMPPMDDEPPMGDDNGGGNTQEIDDIFNSLGIEDQSAVLKYAKSMSDNGGNDNAPDDGMPMENHKYNLDRIIEDVLGREVRGKDRELKRPIKKTSYNDNLKNPFITHR